MDGGKSCTRMVCTTCATPENCRCAIRTVTLPVGSAPMQWCLGDLPRDATERLGVSHVAAGTNSRRSADCDVLLIPAASCRPRVEQGPVHQESHQPEDGLPTSATTSLAYTNPASDVGRYAIQVSPSRSSGE